ncbi:50S ribosomal protein L25 [Thermodesulfobacteriota bacterium]
MHTELNVMLRTERGQKSITRNLRNEGLVPAICYGAIKEPLPITVSAKDLKKALSTEAKEHVLISLKTDKKSEISDTVAILKDIVRHPIKRTYIHADFQVLDMTETLKVSVSVKLIGKAKGIALGGVLDQVRRTVEVVCLPNAIPNLIEVDITGLDLGDTLHVSDIEVREGVEIVTSGNLTIANVVIPTVAAEPKEGEEELEEGEEAAEETKKEE